MSTPTQTIRSISLLCAALALLLGAGCMTMPADTYTNFEAYEPARSPVRIDASARIETDVTITPELRALWKRTLNSDANIENYLKAIGQSLRNDLSTSGLFAQILSADTPPATYLVQVRAQESHPSDYRYSLTLTATELATGARVSTHTREISLGDSSFTFARKRKEATPGLMADLKSALAADLRTKIHRQQEDTARAEAELFTKKSLTELLAGSDQRVDLARQRNRAIIAAKTLQLPGILRDSKTAELSGLVVKIEQTILDLNHESEVAKDRAQQAMANNGPAGQIEELRGLTISYRERIELLKPILAALKEEIANRNR